MLDLSMNLQFEERYNEIDNARSVFERYVEILPSVKAWVRYAKFEMKNGDVARARQCYERAVESLGEEAQTVGVLRVGSGWELLWEMKQPSWFKYLI